jgi:SET domain-containing protein
MVLKPPHHKVYTRLICSKVHGVGVAAIRPIKKGTYVFHGDDSELVWVNAAKVRSLPKEIRRLYEDFAVKKGNLYGCPDSFDHLTPTWFLNHSDNPNVASDEEYRFYALRDIKTGEELKVDYRTYSDLQDRRLR